MTENKENKFDKFIKVFGIVLIIVELIATGAFIAMLFLLNMLPALFMIIICIVLLAITAGLFLLWKAKRANQHKGVRVRRIISSAIAIVLTIVFVIGSYFIYLANHAIETVTNDGQVSQTYKVVVLKNDSASSMADVKDYCFGTIKDLDQGTLSIALEKIVEEDGFELKTSEQSSIKKGLDEFYEGETNGLIYESSAESMFSEFYNSFKDDIKVIKEFTITYDENEIKNVNDVEEETTEAQVEYSSNIKPFIILFSGSDEYDNLSVTGRSDVNMLAVVNFKTRQVLLVSIPRDYYLEIPGISEGQRDKLTHAGIYGINSLCRSIDYAFGVNINYYCRVNFTSVVDIIDAIGGVTINNPYEFTGYDNGMVFEAGEVWYNGYWALQYMRERKTLEGGDLARGQHQQIILEAMINKMVSGASLANYNQLIAAIEKSAIINMPQDLIKEIVRTQLAEGGSWTILKTQALGAEVYQPSYAMDGMEVSVVMPYKESVEFVSRQIRRVYNGEIISDIDEGAPTEFTYITELIESEW